MKRALLALFLPVAVWAAPPQLSKDMPGHSFKGPLPALTASQKKLSASLRADVEHLAVKIGERNQQHYVQLQESRRWVGSQLAAAGYTVHEQTYKAPISLIW